MNDIPLITSLVGGILDVDSLLRSICHLRCFWGCLCEFDPETEAVNARRGTMSFPSRLAKWMEADSESFSMKADPVDDAVVFMVITQYYGREEFEIDGQKRRIRKNIPTRLGQPRDWR